MWKLKFREGPYEATGLENGHMIPPLPSPGGSLDVPTLNPEEALSWLRLWPSSPWLHRTISAPASEQGLLGCGSQRKCQLMGQGTGISQHISKVGGGVEGGAMCFVPIDPQQAKDEG